VAATDTLEPSLLRSVLEDLPIGVRVLLPPCSPIYTNRVFREIVGPGGYRMVDRAGGDYPPEALPAARALRERRRVMADDIAVVRADGTLVEVRAFAAPRFDGAGEVSHILLAFTDVRAEVRAAAEAAAVRERLMATVRHAPIILFATDPNGVITLSEGAAVRALGFEPGAAVGRSVFELYPDNPELKANARRVLQGETITDVVDLHGVVLESWLGPMRGPTGEIEGVIGVSSNVTERVRLEKQVAQAERLSALGRLASSVAHEINNPLAYTVEALRLASEALGELEADGGAAPEPLARLRRVLGEASEGAERVRLTMRDLRSFSRGDEDEHRPLDLDAILGTAIKLVAKRIGTRAAIERVRGPRATVRADENQLVQIFVNLIINAADALPSGEADRRRNRIRVSTRLEDRWAVVEVADSGPGVPEAVRDTIFEPFFTTKPVGEGTGLGLFVTRNVVGGLGGSVTIGDAPEGGALFAVRLPLDGSGEPAAVQGQGSGPIATPTAAAPSRARPNGASQFRALIIDDDPQVSELLRLSLEREFPAATVRAFTSGRSALEHLLGGETYDVVFCDLMMGELSGMQIYEELRRAAPGRERDLVFMTGGVYDSTVGDFLAGVSNDCLDKPFDIRAEVRRRVLSPASGAPPPANAAARPSDR
jgi:PAS domain S-box-containing protein